MLIAVCSVEGLSALAWEDPAVFEGSDRHLSAGRDILGYGVQPPCLGLVPPLAPNSQPQLAVASEFPLPVKNT